jgi:hypothetical protein
VNVAAGIVGGVNTVPLVIFIGVNRVGRLRFGVIKHTAFPNSVLIGKLLRDLIRGLLRVRHPVKYLHDKYQCRGILFISSHSACGTPYTRRLVETLDERRAQCSPVTFLHNSGKSKSQHEGSMRPPKLSFHFSKYVLTLSLPFKMAKNFVNRTLKLLIVVRSTTTGSTVNLNS